MLKDGTLAHNVGSGVGVLQAAQEQLLLVERPRRVVRDGRGVHQPGAIEKGFTTRKKHTTQWILSGKPCSSHINEIVPLELCQTFQTGGEK